MTSSRLFSVFFCSRRCCQLISRPTLSLQMESAKNPMGGLAAKIRFLCLQATCATLDLFLYILPTLVTDLLPPQWSSWRVARPRWGGSAHARQLFKLDETVPALRGLPRWFMSGHTHTILCAFRPAMPIPYQRVCTPSGDGNTMCLDWAFSTSISSPVKGVLVIVPGLASSSATNYVQRFVSCACASGFHCCVSTSRGLGDTPLETPQLMAASWTADLRYLFSEGALSKQAVMQHCNLKEAVPMVGIGISLGGVILSKYIGEEGQANKGTALSAAFVINSPLDSLASNAHMARLVSRIVYQPSMTGGLVAYARRHVHMLKSVPGLPAEVREKLANGQADSVFNSIRTVYDYDLLLNAPANGYDSPESYYADINSFKWLRWAKIPVLCICADDDPCCGPPPTAELDVLSASNTEVAYVILPHGGHLGCVMSPCAEWRGKPTALERLVSRLATVFCEQQQVPAPSPQ